MSAHPLPALLATVDTAARLGLGQDLSYQAVGIAIVLLALGAIAFVLFLLGKVFQSASLAEKTAPARAASTAGTATPPASAAAEKPDSISPETFAVIAAAAYIELPGMSHIVEIRQSPTAQVWSMEGRRQIFQSHKLR